MLPPLLCIADGVGRREKVREREKIGGEKEAEQEEECGAWQRVAVSKWIIRWGKKKAAAQGQFIFYQCGENYIIAHTRNHTAYTQD